MEAMARYWEVELAYIATVHEGLDDVEAGRHRSLEEVTGEWVERGLLAPTWQEGPPEDEG